ncbi:hypothetical protein CVU82_03805 [Candidatus Falkowbacteria bacterium HGW-Falkowbacteria-1]|jgi:tRNA G10  N-methylase Trm11|uniref:Ribosomal RNA large subunit methyltransferase K/L-like methyltransferase domain-containing protein n=1 Tax=Candidatus Falkowbacteria bacterium HGW-Falkowbacteria-1 TaxID=2013768 RepID=A0A2N2E8X2_9BACT|nr:MAG: hypothetical protein CVU82_03805 [Candidatus Falkowbacteria bacterium HGW-Falkowbacteria-1]
MKKYFFALGNNFNLSLAELNALFPKNKWQRCGAIVLSDFSDDLDIKELMLLLGGTIKIGEIVADFSLANRHKLSDSVKEAIVSSARQDDVSGKFNFGFSFYNKNKLSGDFFKLGLAVKKDLKKLDISSRMVMSREPILSSVVVEQNKLLRNGIELCFMVDKTKVFLGKTLAVQDFKSLSKRDFGRPNRDDHSGMIPPKLAQIMINLARRDDKKYKKKVLIDPFCGSGTILMEAYLMGFEKIIGSDLSDKAVLNSQKNIEWIENLFNKNKSNINIFQADVLNLSKNLEENSLDYIVCEPYLGPQRGFKNFDEVVEELNVLYSGSLKVLFKLLKPGGRIVMVWPQFRAENKIWKINPNVDDFVFRPTLDIDEKEFTALSLDMSDLNGTIVYGREEQKVWREVIVLEK